MVINIIKDNKSDSKQPVVYDLGTVTTTLQSLLNNSRITITDKQVILLKVTQLDTTVSYYFLPFKDYNGDSLYGYGKEIVVSDLISIGGGGSIATPTIAQVLTAGSVSNSGQTLDIIKGAGFTHIEGQTVITNQGNGAYAGLTGTSIIAGNPTGQGFVLGASNITSATILEAPNSGVTARTLPVSVNGTYADTAGNITISSGGDLQATTDLGAITTNQITVQNIEIGSNAFANTILGQITTLPTGTGTTAIGYNAGSGTTGFGGTYVGALAGSLNAFNKNICISANANASTASADNQFVINTNRKNLRFDTNIPLDILFQFPEVGGRFPISVNGNTADSNGNITVPSSTPTTGVTFNGTNISLTNTNGTSYLSYTQTTTINFALSASPVVLGFAALKVIANGSPINPDPAWKNVGGDVISSVNGAVNRFMFTQVDGEVWYTVKVN